MSNKENQQPAPPSIAEIKIPAPVIRSNREAAQQKIADNEAQIASTKQTLYDLTRERFDLNEVLNSTSPVLSILPLDIFTSIFTIVCEEDQEDKGWQEDKEYHDHLPTQFLIGRVCREWRRIVWNTPRLWSTMVIALSQSRFERQEPLIHEWIDRTSTSPLTLHFVQSSSKPTDKETNSIWDPPIEFCRYLLESCDRWEVFEFGIPSVNFQMALKTPGTQQFPLLKGLIVIGREIMREQDIPKDEWKLNSPPILETVSLECFGTLEMDINWSSIKGLDLTLPFDAATQLLGLCSTSESLGWLRLHLVPERDSELRFPDTAFTAPNLIDLNIRGEANTVGFLLSVSTLPALKCLTLNVLGMPGVSSPWPDHFIAMAHRSKFVASYLKIAEINAAISEEKLLEVISMVPKLKCLVLEHPPKQKLSDVTLNRLTLNQDLSNPDLRPSERRIMKERSLEYLLEFRYMGPITFTLDGLHAFLKSRSTDVWEEEEDYAKNEEKLRKMNESTDQLPSFSPNYPFRAQIIYTNKPWFFHQNPNELHTFYKKLEMLPTVDLFLNQPTVQP